MPPYFISFCPADVLQNSLCSTTALQSIFHSYIFLANRSLADPRYLAALLLAVICSLLFHILHISRFKKASCNRKWNILNVPIFFLFFVFTFLFCYFWSCGSKIFKGFWSEFWNFLIFKYFYFLFLLHTYTILSFSCTWPPLHAAWNFCV